MVLLLYFALSSSLIFSDGFCFKVIFFLFLIFHARVSLCRPGHPGTLGRPGWPLTQRSACICLLSAGRSKVCTTTPGCSPFFWPYHSSPLRDTHFLLPLSTCALVTPVCCMWLSLDISIALLSPLFNPFTLNAMNVNVECVATFSLWLSCLHSVVVPHCFTLK